MPVDIQELINQGERLSDAEARQLEEHLRRNPDDVKARVKLLGYYWKFSLDSQQAAAKARQSHILWLAQNRPEEPVLGTPYAMLHPPVDGEAFHRVRDALLQQVQKNPGNVRILANARDFLSVHDRPKAVELAKRVWSLAPHNPEHAESLAHLYEMEARNTDNATARKRHYQQALAVLESTLNRVRMDHITYVNLLRSTADIAARAEEWRKAQRYAQDLLRLASKPTFVFEPDADGIHAAHTVLGKVALGRGDIEAAKNHLLDSARVEGSPVLSSFGPDFTLARALLERGERQTVLEYLSLCERFWVCGRDRLAKYRHIIERGGMPDFGFKGE
ncbi:MAG: hypothetical protein RMM08_02220 [Armatimonadota bacterium]|nr:hypothetical protein [bacterium]MDW8320155.1 hypothetical protein [Armatimonadota bacterium]